MKKPFLLKTFFSRFNFWTILFSKIMPYFWITDIHRRNFSIFFPSSMLILDEKKHFYGSVLMKIINSRFEYLNMSRVHKTPRKKVWFIINCRYKESKEIKAGLKELKIAIANPSCDKEVLRDYFLKLIRKFVFSALDEIYSFKTEKEILARMAQMGQQSFFF